MSSVDIFNFIFYILECGYFFTFFRFIYLYFIKILFIYFQREGKGGRKGGREASVGCLSHTPDEGPGPQPRNLPWLGIELATFLFLEQSPAHRAAPVRAWMGLFKACGLTVSQSGDPVGLVLQVCAFPRALFAPYSFLVCLVAFHLAPESVYQTCLR